MTEFKEDDTFDEIDFSKFRYCYTDLDQIIYNLKDIEFRLGLTSALHANENWMGALRELKAAIYLLESTKKSYRLEEIQEGEK